MIRVSLAILATLCVATWGLDLGDFMDSSALQVALLAGRLQATISSFGGFSLFMAFFASTLHCGHLTFLLQDLITFSIGVYFATAFPCLYQLAAAIQFLAWLGPAGRLEQVNANITVQLPPWARMAQDSLPCPLGFRQQVLLAAWLPVTLSWSTVLRLFLFGVLVPMLGFFFALHSADECLGDILDMALHVHQEFVQNQELKVGAISSVLFIWFLPLPGTIFVLLVLGGFMCLVLLKDRGLVATYQQKLQQIYQVLPTGAALEEELDREFIFILQHIYEVKQMWGRALEERKEGLEVFATAGFSVALVFSACSWLLHYVVAPFYSIYPGAFLVIAGVVSYTARNQTQIDRSPAFLLGIFVFLTLELAFTGCACGYKVGLNLWTVMVPLLTHVLWIWIAVPVTLLWWHFYTWKLSLRQVLFRFWHLARKSRAEQILQFEVPGTKEDILDEALHQVSQGWEKVDFQVSFTTSSGFTTDAIDAGGLSKHFTSLIAKAFTEGSVRRQWGFIRLWDPAARPEVYHLNYEAGRIEEALPDSSVEVEDEFRRAGSLLALIFLKQLPFLRLSTALIKFLLDGKVELTLADLKELLPTFATYLQTPLEEAGELFGHYDLPATFLDSGWINVVTGIPEGAWDASEMNQQQVIWAMLRNHHVMPLMEAFREGFRTRLQLPNLNQIFSAEEVQKMLATSDSVDLVDWQRHTAYKNCNARHPAVRKFWGALEDCTQKQLQGLLFQATGLSTPSSEGFRAFTPIFNISLIQWQDATERLRDGGVGFHTCSNTVDLLDTLTQEQFVQYIQSLAEGQD